MDVEVAQKKSSVLCSIWDDDETVKEWQREEKVLKRAVNLNSSHSTSSAWVLSRYLKTETWQTADKGGKKAQGHSNSNFALTLNQKF